MSNVVQLLIFCIATYWVAVHGIARTFAQVFIPALLFFFLTPQLNLPGVPDIWSFSAVGYPVLFMSFAKWDEVRRVKWNALDIMVTIMMISPTISVITNNGAWEGIGLSGEIFFKWLMPYFMARIAFFDPEARRLMLKTLCICTIIIGCMAAFEARLKPYFFSRTMERLGIAKTFANEQVFPRFGLMRAQTTLGHPIDLGNCGVILGGMILTLVPIVKRKWNDPLILAGIMGAGAMVVGAVSFTGMVATLVAFSLMMLFSMPQIGKYFILPSIIGLMIAMAGFMYYMVNKEVSEDRPEDEVAASVWARDKVAQDSWAFAQESGLFGSGLKLDTQGMGTGRGSIDNSYMLFAMQFGWIYLIQWLILGLVIGYTGTRAMSAAQSPSERRPIAAAMGGIIAIFGAMFTVYYGFVYAIIIVCFFGCLSTMTQLLTNRGQNPLSASIPYASPMQRGFPVNIPR